MSPVFTRAQRCCGLLRASPRPRSPPALRTRPLRRSLHALSCPAPSVPPSYTSTPRAVRGPAVAALASAGGVQTTRRASPAASEPTPAVNLAHHIPPLPSSSSSRPRPGARRRDASTQEGAARDVEHAAAACHAR
eukprot:1496187-Rhodomonas_salina.1